MRWLALALVGCSTRTENPSGCPGHVPEPHEPCDTTAACSYENARTSTCSDTLPIFDCVNGEWSQRRIEIWAECPTEVPKGLCPTNIRCVNNVRTLVCNYACVRAQCTPSSSWLLRGTCDGGKD